MSNKITLLKFLTDNYNYSEKEASALIMAGRVLVNENVIDKTGYRIKNSDKIRIKQKKEYVSRGAYKLLTALKNFNINIKDKIAIDIGSSTGGFTEVLLKNGVKRVYAIDCGKNQLNYLLRINPKVIVMENRVIQSLNKNDFFESIDIAVMDLSFTSSIPIINHVFNELGIKELICLIKPQFEFNRYKERLNLSSDFNGIVKEDDRIKIVNEIKKEISGMNLHIINFIQSEIKGAKGNIEYLFYIKRDNF